MRAVADSDDGERLAQPEIGRTAYNRIGLDQLLDALQGARIMNTDRKLGEVAAKLDDMSETVEELQDAAQDKDAKPRAAMLDELKQDLEEASDAIDDVVDPEQPRKS